MSADPHDPVPREHGKEVRVFGPPGTGKTTWLSGSIRNTVMKRQTNKVMVASFTRTAAEEIGSRGLPLSRDKVGTLHAFAYRAIDHPSLVNDRIIDWNKAHPSIALTLPKDAKGKQAMEQPVEEWVGATYGDVLMARLNNLRNRMTDRALWPPQVLAFERRWSEWKAREGLVDFTDMIEMALTDTETAPNDPEVGFFDEVQDFTRLELSLVRHWGERMDRLILAGDDDQCVYSFKGATPDAFLDPPVADRDKYVLNQSFRVPAAVHRVAEAWITRLSRREPKVYLPRDDEGRVRLGRHRWSDPEQLVREIGALSDSGKTVMVLATCAYMLDPIKHAMKAAGLPFHNPYRRVRSDWNPLMPSRGTASAERLLSYLILDERAFGEDSREWTGADVKRWSAALKTAPFTKGVRSFVDGLPEGTLSYGTIVELFGGDTEDLARATVPEIEWYASHLLAGSKPGMEFPLNVVRRRGPRALVEAPRVCLGTIHSVKGGQADVVYLFPDLSARGYQEWAGRAEQRDNVIRQMYVGMTRAKEELVLCAQASHLAVPPERMLAGKRAPKAAA